MLESLLLGPFFFLPLIPRFLRFRTLRYHWDDHGITARWGLLFRREISLDFERIQDIHLSSHIAESWLGLAKVQLQTASGSSRAEMTIEGLQDFKEVRDFLYSRMRGVRGSSRDPRVVSSASARGFGAADGGDRGTDDLVQVLEATAAELRALREEFAAARGETTQRGSAPSESDAP